MEESMAVERNHNESVIDLDRKVSRALQCGRGITLSPSQLDVLAEIGLVGRLAEEKARILKEQAQWRQKKVASTSGASSGSTSTVGPVENPIQAAGISSGMTPEEAGSAARARARQTFG
nr:hypothetical protein BV87_02810 [Sphingobium yanoikuyae]